MIVKSKSDTGQAVVEFAFVAPLLCILLLGILEFGVLLYDKAVITNASREGARAGIVFQGDTNGNFVEHPLSEIETVVRSYLLRNLITFGRTPDITVLAPTTGTSPSNHDFPGSGYITVTVTYHHTYLALPNFLGWGNAIDIAAETIMRLE